MMEERAEIARRRHETAEATVAALEQSNITSAAKLAEGEGVAVADLLEYTDADIAELMKERQIGVTPRKRIEKEVVAIKEAEAQMQSAQGLEQKGNMNGALAKYQAAEAHYQGTRLGLTERISAITAALEAQRLEEEGRRAKAAAALEAQQREEAAALEAQRLEEEDRRAKAAAALEAQQREEARRRAEAEARRRAEEQRQEGAWAVESPRGGGGG